MELMIRKGTVEDIENVIQLFQIIREEMEHKEWFYLDPPEDIREMMKNGTMQLWVAMDRERIIGAFDLLIPGMEPYNYGYDLNFSQDELRKAVNMDTAAVHPDYRGMGLQRKLVRMGETSLAGTGHRILLCTVHPENRFSLQNVLKQGYEIQKETAMYGSVRYILRKDIF